MEKNYSMEGKENHTKNVKSTHKWLLRKLKSSWHLPFIFVFLEIRNKHLTETIKCFAWIFSFIMTTPWNIPFLIRGNRYRKFVTCIGHQIMVKKNAGNSFISLSFYTFVVHFTSSSDNSCYICFWAICKLLWFSQHNFYLFLLCQVLYFHLLNRDWNWGINVIAFWNFGRVNSFLKTV